MYVRACTEKYMLMTRGKNWKQVKYLELAIAMRVVR